MTQVEVDPGTPALEEIPDAEFSEITDLAPMVEESIPAESMALEEPDLAGYLDATASGPLEPVDVPGAQEIVSIEVDFDSLAELVPVSATETEGGVVEPLVAMEEIPLAEPERDLVPPVSDMVEEEQIKVIGSLRIGIPLYNVYLNEADEWSRRLSNQLSEWSLEVHRPVPSDAEALAHSLAGSSATVGFSSLSDMARALEHALQHMAGQQGGTDHQGRVFREAAEDIRRLLHQFAAGFLKEPNPFILEELRALEFGDAVSASQVVEAPVFPLEPAQTLAAPLVEDMQPVAPTAESFAEPAVSDSLHDDVLDATMPVEGVEPAPAPVPVEVRPPEVLPVAEIFAQRAFEGQTSETDDIDLVDVLDPDLFPIFEEEAGELLPQLGGALRQWSARPENVTARGEVLRALHTLKGSARLAGALQLGEMAHRMESEIEAIGSGDIHGEDVAPLMARLDAIEGKFEALRKINLQTFMPELLEPMASALVQEAPVFAAPGTEEAPVERGVIAQPSPMLVAPVLSLIHI